jgi:cation:H+ antiporter
LQKKLILALFSFILLILDLLIGFYNITTKFNILIIPDIIISVASIYMAGDIFLDVSYSVGKSLSFSEKYVGLFIVGFAAIVDEIAMSVMAAVQNLGTVSFGTIQGSNVITLLAFFILIPLYYKSGISKFRLDAYVITATAIILLILSFYIIKLPYYIGFITLIIFLFYIAKKVKSPGSRNVIATEESYPSYYGILAIIVIILASYNMIDAALVISHVLKITAFLSSFFLLGFFGSLPEIMMMSISLKDKRKNVSIGLITGSTLYKETILFSIIAFIGTLTFKDSFFSLVLMVIFSIVLIIYTILFA